jgi:type I restriction enzyme S subunit
VDFDPVVANAAGRKPAHLRSELAALFPATFQESPLGPIPHGWRTRPVSEVVVFNPVRRLAKGKAAPYLDMRNVPTNSALPENWAIRSHGSGMKFQNGDTLLARITPCLENGKTAFVNALADGEVGWGSTEYIVMRPRPPLPLEYGYFLARSDDFRAHAITNMTGSSGRQRVAANCFDQFLVAEPPKEIAGAFGDFAAPLMQMMKANVEESRTLAALRDALLPKLLSGELRVKQAENLVEAKV